MEKKIYIVTAGEYSDYHIEAAFSTKKKANEYVQHNGTECQIKEYELDAQYFRGPKIWDIHIDVNGNEVISAKSLTMFDKNDIRLKDKCVIRDYLRKKRCDLYIVTDTMDRAIKIAKERYSSLKSNQYIWEKMNTKVKVQMPYIGGLLEYPYFNFVTNEFEGMDCLWQNYKQKRKNKDSI